MRKAESSLLEGSCKQGAQGENFTFGGFHQADKMNKAESPLLGGSCKQDAQGESFPFWGVNKGKLPFWGF